MVELILTYTRNSCYDAAEKSDSWFRENPQRDLGEAIP